VLFDFAGYSSDSLAVAASRYNWINQMTKILCFGDSNTWGYQANSGKRFTQDQRWPGVLAKLIGKQAQVIENGLPGRTTYLNAIEFGFRSGIDDLLAELRQQRPDWLIIMLGTNDLFPAFGLSAKQVAANLEKMLKELTEHCAQQQLKQPKILILAPLAINQSGSFAELFRGAEHHSQDLSGYYQRLAVELNCEYLDVAKHVTARLEDGVHLNETQHRALAKALAQKLLDECDLFSTQQTL